MEHFSKALRRPPNFFLFTPLLFTSVESVWKACGTPKPTDFLSGRLFVFFQPIVIHKQDAPSAKATTRSVMIKFAIAMHPLVCAKSQAGFGGVCQWLAHD